MQAAIPALAALAGKIGDPQVRNKGTIGGSIANNDPAADYPAALVGLGATVVTNARTIAADDFFTGLFETALEEGEIITAVRFPPAHEGRLCEVSEPGVALRHRRRHGGGDGRWRAHRRDRGGALRVPRVTAMEAALGDSLDAGAALPALSPDGLNSDIHASAEYRAHLVGVMAQRAMAAAG